MPQFEAGDRVELVHTSDPHTSLEPGDRGEVTGTSTVPGEVTPTGRPETQVWVDWDSGSNLMMILGEDRIKKAEAEAEA